MKAFLVSLLFLALLVMSVPVSFAQPDQSYQKLAQEIEILKSQLQTVENTDKMKLSAELANAKATLVNTEFEKFERDLRDSNDGWLLKWSAAFVGVIAISIAILFGVSRVYWYWLSSKTEKLIAAGIQERLNRFQETVEQLDEIKNQLKVLQTGHAVSVLEHFMHVRPGEESDYRKQTALIPEEALLQVFGDETRYMELRLKAAEILADRKSPLLVAPLLKRMHSIVDDNSEYDHYDIRNWGRELIKPLGRIHTQASYQGLKQFLNRLLTEDSEYKRWLLTPTVFTLTEVSIALNKSDSVSILRKSIADLEVPVYRGDDLMNLVEYFYKFDATEGIKEIMRHGLTNETPDVETRCLELLENLDPEFVSDWREQKAAGNTETEETS